MAAGVLCYPVISMLYATTLDIYLGSVYLFTSGILIIAIINTLYVYKYLTMHRAPSDDKDIVSDANETLGKMSELTMSF